MAGDFPRYQQLEKHLLAQVILRFDYSPVLKLADKTPAGELITAKKNDFVEKYVEKVRKLLPLFQYEQTSPEEFIFQVTDNGPQARREPRTTVHKFATPDGATFIETSFLYLAVAMSGAQYKGFSAFLDLLFPVWQVFSTDFAIDKVKRVGIRKINHIVKPGTPDSVRFDAEVSEEVLGPTRAFGASLSEWGIGLHRKEDTAGPENRVTIGTRQGHSDGKDATLLFLDFDVFSAHVRNNDGSMREYLQDVLNHRHWELFCNFMNRKKLQELGLKA